MANVNFEAERIEEDAVAHVQAMALRLLDKQQMPRKELARCMGVTEPRISQLFAAEPKNLTIKSAARLFFHLGEELTFSCKGIEAMNVEARRVNKERASALSQKQSGSEWTIANANIKAVASDYCVRDVA